MKRVVYGLLGLLLVMLAPVSRTRAAGLAVNPAFQDVVIKAGQAEQTGSISVSNLTATAQTLQVSVVDLSTLLASGGSPFLGLSPTTLDQRYGLANWIDLDETKLVLQPNASGTVSFKIENTDSLAAGGHYGALLLQPVPAKGTGSSAGKTSIQSVISALLFVKKEGGEQYGMDLEKLEVALGDRNLPRQVTVTVHNTGTVHVVPRGTVSLTDPRGREIARGVINLDSTLVLPSTSRSYTVSLTSLGTPVWPGHYTLTVNYRYDGQADFKVVERRFSLFDGTSVAAALNPFLFLAVLLAAWRRFRLYRRAHPRHR